MRLRAAVIATAVLLTIVGSSPAAAQEPDPDTVFTILAAYPPGADQGAIQSHREDQGTLTATVDGLACATIDIRPHGEIPLYLGTPTQPEPCAQPGAEVILYNLHGNEMFQRFTIELGEVATLYNYAVAPVSTDGPLPGASGNAGTLSTPPNGPGVAAVLGLVALVILAAAAARRHTIDA